MEHLKAEQQMNEFPEKKPIGDKIPAAAGIFCTCREEGVSTCVWKQGICRFRLRERKFFPMWI